MTREGSSDLPELPRVFVGTCGRPNCSSRTGPSKRAKRWLKPLQPRRASQRSSYTRSHGLVCPQNGHWTERGRHKKDMKGPIGGTTGVEGSQRARSGRPWLSDLFSPYSVHTCRQKRRYLACGFEPAKDLVKELKPLPRSLPFQGWLGELLSIAIRGSW